MALYHKFFPSGVIKGRDRDFPLLAEFSIAQTKKNFNIFNENRFQRRDEKKPRIWDKTLLINKSLPIISFISDKKKLDRADFLSQCLHQFQLAPSG